MKLAILLALACAIPGHAQDSHSPLSTEAGPSVVSLFFARDAQRLQAPYVNPFHYLEFLQIRKRWIYPDIGYVDFCHGNYREFFVGGGRTLFENKRAFWGQELLIVPTAGSAAKGALYLQPFTIVQIHFTPRFDNETVYFAYLPLNQAAKVHQVLERSKFEYSLTKRLKMGPGYAAVYDHRMLINKPFLTTTISTRAGDFEFWLQKIPGGAALQLRYALVHLSR